MLHSSQNTQASIESYYGALKRWLSLETKGFRGWWIDWLMQKLTTTIVKHCTPTWPKQKNVGLSKTRLWNAS
jgi:hypothetical protein